jgi:zinc transporter ZupT
MGVAALLTALAVVGIGAGVSLGQARLLSAHVAAAGGGLLLGIALFWLMPEIAEQSGWWWAVGMTLTVGFLVGLADRVLVHSKEHGHGHRFTIAPVLAATATHSFLDGWSVRALQTLQMEGIAAAVGLALHKIPEGMAIGWIARRHIHSPKWAITAAIAAESVTLLGAYVEPSASKSAFAKFGPLWASALLALVSGSFLFLGLHAVLPNRRKASVMAIFAITIAVVASVGLFQFGKI